MMRLDRKSWWRRMREYGMTVVCGEEVYHDLIDLSARVGKVETILKQEPMSKERRLVNYCGRSESLGFDS